MINTKNESYKNIWFTDDVSFEIWYGKIGEIEISIKTSGIFLQIISYFFLEYDESNRAEVAVDCGQSHKSRYQIKKAIAKNYSVTSKQVPVTYASSLPPISIKGLYLNITKNYLKMPRYWLIPVCPTRKARCRPSLSLLPSPSLLAARQSRTKPDSTAYYYRALPNENSPRPLNYSRSSYKLHIYTYINNVKYYCCKSYIPYTHVP